MTITDNHLLQRTGLGLAGIADFYVQLMIIPTSEVADIVLIRSHIAYHMGVSRAERAIIRPSRGHSYKVGLYSSNWDFKNVRIIDHYDHRDGVTGIV